MPKCGWACAHNHFHDSGAFLPEPLCVAPGFTSGCVTSSLFTRVLSPIVFKEVCIQTIFFFQSFVKWRLVKASKC